MTDKETKKTLNIVLCTVFSPFSLSLSCFITLFSSLCLVLSQPFSLFVFLSRAAFTFLHSSVLVWLWPKQHWRDFFDVSFKNLTSRVFNRLFAFNLFLYSKNLRVFSSFSSSSSILNALFLFISSSTICHFVFCLWMF